jgi:hypothetical protein
MGTVDNIMRSSESGLRNIIKNFLKTDKLKSDIIRDLEYQNEILEYMLKIAYSQITNKNAFTYDEWRQSLTDFYKKDEQ